jgi:hypothetical protein
MHTTHVCLRTYYVQDRLGKVRPITTETYIITKLKKDLLLEKALKSLNKAGHRIIMDAGNDDSGMFAVDKNGKIDKSNTVCIYEAVSEHSSLFFFQNRTKVCHSI